MLKSKNTLLLGIILLIGIVLRVYSLGVIPGSLNWDEVSWGYNSYSIAETGMDEYGEKLPLSFKAFGDYKQPVYIYLDSVFVKVLGLNPIGVRAVSAVFGSLSILLVYFMVRELFLRRSEGKKIAILTAFLFAISPWSIQFSRIAYEANVGLFFIILGVFIFLKGLNSQKYLLLFSSVIPFTIAGFSYHSLKIFTPLFFIFLLIYSFRYIKVKKILGFLLLSYLLLNLFWILDLRTTSRGRSVTFFLQPSKILEPSMRDLAYDKEQNDYLGMLIHDRRVVYLNKYAQNYLTHFDPSYLFIRGDNPRHHAPGVGLLYLVSLPFIILGIYFFARHRITESIIVFVWLLLAPVASSLAIDAPNASRSLIFLPTWDILFAAGAVFIEKTLSRKYLLIFRIVFWSLILTNFLYFSHQYFVHTNTETQRDWQFGYKEAVEYAGQLAPEQRIVFSADIEQGYIFYLFYNKYSPKKYIEEGGSARNFNKCYSIKNSYFGDCQKEVKAGDIFVTSNETQNINNHPLNKIKMINYEDNSPAILIYKVL